MTFLLTIDLNERGKTLQPSGENSGNLEIDINFLARTKNSMIYKIKSW